VFGEALLPVVKGEIGNKVVPDVKKNDDQGPRHQYGIRMLSSSEVHFISKQVLDEFFAGGTRRRQEMRKAFFQKLESLCSCRRAMLAPMVCFALPLLLRPCILPLCIVSSVLFCPPSGTHVHTADGARCCVCAPSSWALVDRT